MSEEISREELADILSNAVKKFSNTEINIERKESMNSFEFGPV